MKVLKYFNFASPIFASQVNELYPEDQIDGILEVQEEIKIRHMNAIEQQNALEVIFQKVDVDGNNQLDKDEMHDWMHKLERHIMNREVNEHYGKYDLDHNGQLTEDELITAQNLSGRTPEEEKEMNSEIERFRAADEDNDLELTREEFFAFLYPRNYQRTKYLYVREIMDGIDTDNDNVLTFDEFLLTKGLDVEDESEQNKVQLELERRSFDLKDVNLNGALEGSELETFINPPNVNWYESEVAHLIQKCDRNDDKLISKIEMINEYSHVVNSHFLAHGDIHHDEL